jgi:hypothetical protein
MKEAYMEKNPFLYALLKDMAQAIVESGMGAPEIADASGGLLSRLTPYRINIQWMIISVPGYQGPKSVKLTVPPRKTVQALAKTLQVSDETRNRWIIWRDQAEAEERRGVDPPEVSRARIQQEKEPVMGVTEFSLPVGGAKITGPLHDRWGEGHDAGVTTEKDLTLHLRQGNRSRRNTEEAAMQNCPEV